MNISVQGSLCRGLRACGMTKEETHLLLNTIIKWYDSNGAQWTNDRIKAYKAWYESYFAGNPEVPSWFRHGRDNLPLDIWKRVFKLKNPARAFAVLSMNTSFVSKEILPQQKRKFLDALSASPRNRGQFTGRSKPTGHKTPRRSLPELTLTAPAFDSITGKSIPLTSGEGKRIIRTEDDVILAYADSWATVPLPTLRYLRREGQLQQVPPGLLVEGGRDGIFATLPEQDTEAGFIGVIQEPGLKARWVANTHRITQHYLRPLGEDWYRALRRLPSDCTFDQEKGISWVQSELRAGKSLSGSDLSSASDLLDRWMSLDYALGFIYGMTYADMRESGDPTIRSYASAVEHFLDISASEWVFQDGTKVTWGRGQPLGTHPSFALMGLTNNLVAAAAAQETYHDGKPFSHFRVIGDDIIMHTEMLDCYNRGIQSLGGEVNHSKTLTSDRVAEFAGRIITPDRFFLKTVKYKDMGDNSFMSVLSNLGTQAKGLLRPRQRRQYELFKFVPGVVVSGPWQQDSLGQPLDLRYDWYLNRSGLVSEKLSPDQEVLTPERFCMKVFYTLEACGRKNDFDFSVPFALSDEFHSSLATAAIETKSGDPRLRDWGGKTTLQVLEMTSSADTFESYRDFISAAHSRMLQEYETLVKRVYPLCESPSDLRTLAGITEEPNLRSCIEKLQHLEKAVSVLNQSERPHAKQQGMSQWLADISAEKERRKSTPSSDKQKHHHSYENER